MTRYVLGFAISKSSRVLLIRKRRPMWQQGKLNGIGGKIEGNESDAEAMVREFWEETAVRTVKGQWHHFATLEGSEYEVICFVTYSNRLVQLAKSATDEPIEAHDIADLYNQDTLPNVPYLVGLANDEELQFPITLKYGLKVL
jgi:8-oxo-dGTP diphosphatase